MSGVASGLAHLTSQSPSYAKTPRSTQPSPVGWEPGPTWREGPPQGQVGGADDQWKGVVRTHTQPRKGHRPHAKQPRGLSPFQGQDLVRGQSWGPFSQSRFESKRSPPKSPCFRHQTGESLGPGAEPSFVPARACFLRDNTLAHAPGPQVGTRSACQVGMVVHWGFEPLTLRGVAPGQSTKPLSQAPRSSANGHFPSQVGAASWPYPLHQEAKEVCPRRA